MNNEALLEVRNLVKHYRNGGTTIHAVNGVSFSVRQGETLGLVGESGCGKSTTGKVIVNLEQATSGEVTYRGQDLLTIPKRHRPAMRRRIQMVFQDPYGSLNQRMRVGRIIAEPLEVHRIGTSAVERRRRVEELLEQVGLDAGHAERFPHEFSGGQRQRIGIARALAVEPQLVVCDEPVSALDVSVQAQVINLLRRLQDTHGLSYLFIAHDLSVVHHISDRIAVMYLGSIVEQATTEALFERPTHPYTQALLSSIPKSHPRQHKARIMLTGDLPSAASPPTGCPFHTRCRHVLPRCRVEAPTMKRLTAEHFAACHLA